ncbi:MAG: NUDIX hydrolase [Fastidiosipilaceae bacterium]
MAVAAVDLIPDPAAARTVEAAEASKRKGAHMSTLTTLCYIERDGCYLMLHRNKKENDLNAGKWIGVGGKFEPGESPDDCLIREVCEETGLRLTAYRCRGVITFIYDDNEAEYMHLFTATEFEGEPKVECSEGVLRWVPIPEVPTLNIWPGDRVFLDLLAKAADFFSLKLVYRDDRLIQAVLDGRPLMVTG